jgi:hypothetical protein
LGVVLQQGCDVRLSANKSEPCFRQVRREIVLGNPVVALVSGADYYNVSEEWYHYVALLPARTGFRVIDPYCRRGFQDYDNWKEHMEHAVEYAWDKWCGAFVSIMNRRR